MSLNIRRFTFLAIAAALAFLLSLFSINYAESFYLELGIVPVLFIARRFGVFYGALCGLLYGTLQILTGSAHFLSVPQGLLEYLLAPASLGLAGLYFSVKTSLVWRTLFISLAVLVKYVFHFIAGLLFWSAYAWHGWNSGLWLVLYSLITNSISALVSLIVALIVLSALFRVLNSRSSLL